MGFTGFEVPGLGFEFCWVFVWGLVWGFAWGVAAAYAAAGRAMKRVRAEKRMAVGIVKCCWNAGELQIVVVSFRCLASTSYRFLRDYVYSASVKTC